MTMLIIIASILLLYLLLRILVVIHLIYVYNKAIKELPEDFEEAHKYLCKKNLQSGICFYIESTNIPYLFICWIYKYSPIKNKAYWYNCPNWHKNTDKIKELLQLRKDRLIYVLKRLTIFK